MDHTLFLKIGIDYAKQWYGAQPAWTKAAPSKVSEPYTSKSWYYTVGEVKETLNYYFFLKFQSGYHEIATEVDFGAAQEYELRNPGSKAVHAAFAAR